MATAMQTITDNLDLWTSALLTKSTAGRGSGGRVEAYGIKKLRELIYELAAKGLLVDTTPKAPAKIVRIEDIADLVMGQAPPGNDCNKDGVGTVFVKTGEFGELCPDVVEWTTNPLKFAKLGDVLICVVGATVGKLNLAIDCAIGRSVAAIRPRESIDTKYLYFALTPYTLKLRNQSRGSAQGVIGKVELNAVELRLPPMEEQHRIVAKVDELMTLCDQLEQHQTTASEAHQTLVETLLGTLTNTPVRPEPVEGHVSTAHPSTSSGRTEFDENWTRIANHFDTLFTTEQSIDQLKQTIIQLAVMGKLVPQDPSDEPVDNLFNRIVAERQSCKGSTAKESLSVDDSGMLGYTIPDSWQWHTLNDLLISGPTNGFSPTAVDFETPVRSLTLSATTSGRFKDEHYKYLVTEVPSDSELWLRDGDILVQRGNSIEYVGVSVVYKGKPNQFIYPDLMMKLRVSSALEVDFVHIAMSHLTARDYLRARATGTSGSMPKINQTTLKSLPIPLPPLAEQHRIVTKVNELMTLCDTLKARLAAAQTTQLHLADTIVEQALA